MRSKLIISALLLSAMLVMPLIFMEKSVSVKEDTSEIQNNGSDYVSVMLTENGKIENMDKKEYIIGALAAETDMNYCDEALKAQAVACYTYYLYAKEEKSEKNLNGADISDDTSCAQGYLNSSKRKEKWGKDFEKYEEKAKKIVDSVYGEYISYKNEPINAVYFDSSNGQTQSAKSVWGEEIPYLQSVTSVGDKLSPKMETVKKYKSNEFMSYIKSSSNLKIDGNAENWIEKINKNEYGYVNNVIICGQKISGSKFRSIFSLNSSVFDIRFKSDVFTIIAYGSGHFVGMSQYGADYMARQGADYKEILKHYYSGIEIVKNK